MPTDPNETIAHNSPSGASTLPPRIDAPPFRGLTVDYCDIGHQAIAFAGSCPLCRRRGRVEGLHGSRPLIEGDGIYATDLKRLLRMAFYDEGAGARR